MSFSGYFDLLCLSHLFKIEIIPCVDVIFSLDFGFSQILSGQYLTGGIQKCVLHAWTVRIPKHA